MCALEVIDDETHDREHGIFIRCAIECEGIEGTAESPVGSINFASLIATGENYVIRKVKGGVKCLEDILSGGVGMNDIHTISLYVLLGNSTFAVMLKNIFNLDMDGLDDDFLVRLKCESTRENRKMLENRVPNSYKLDTAEEATLSKLTAAHESHKKDDCESYQSIAVKNRWSADEDSMLAQLVETCNSTRTKWTKLSCQMENRTPKQCRKRYNNSLKPDGKKGHWTEEEDENIFRLEFGNTSCEGEARAHLLPRPGRTRLPRR